MAIAVLGMAFAGQMNAQDDAKVIGGSGKWTTFYDVNLGGGIRLIGCDGDPANCAPEVVVTP